MKSALNPLTSCQTISGMSQLPKESSFFKLMCLQHDDEIVKICTKPTCKYKRFLCKQCIPSSNQRKHLTQHPEMETLTEILLPLQAPDVIRDILSNAEKYFKFLADQLLRKEHEFRNKQQSLYQQLVLSDQYFESMGTMVKINRFDTSILGYAVMERLQMDESGMETEQAKTFINLALQLKNRMVETLSAVTKSTKELIQSPTTRPNIFINTIGFRENIQITQQEDLKKLKCGSSQNTSICISFPRQVQLNYNAEIATKKTSMMKMKELSLSLVNLPSKDISKIELPIDCQSLILNLKRRAMTKSLVENLKRITQEVMKKRQINESKTVFNKLSIDFLESNIKDESVVQGISCWIGMYQSLRQLKLNFKLNRISRLGVILLMNQIQKLGGIEVLDLDFGGVCQVTNRLDGTMAVIGITLQKLTRLKCLRLGLSNTNIDDSDIIELADHLLEIRYLTKLEIGIETNPSITDIDQFIYKLSFCEVDSLVLGLNGIKIKNPRLHFIIQCFNESDTLKNLVIEAKNCNVLKEQSLVREKGDRYRLNMNIIY